MLMNEAKHASALLGRPARLACGGCKMQKKLGGDERTCDRTQCATAANKEGRGRGYQEKGARPLRGWAVLANNCRRAGISSVTVPVLLRCAAASSLLFSLFVKSPSLLYFVKYQCWSSVSRATSQFCGGDGGSLAPRWSHFLCNQLQGNHPLKNLVKMVR